MKHQTNDQNRKPQQTRPDSTDAAKQQKQKAERQEVVGRHKNDGQISHRGAR